MQQEEEKLLYKCFWVCVFVFCISFIAFTIPPVSRQLQDVK